MIDEATNSWRISKKAANLFTEVASFKNKTWNVGGTPIIMDKTAYMHILGRHNPDFFLGEVKKMQLFTKLKGKELVNTIDQMIRDGGEDLRRIIRDGSGKLTRTIDDKEFVVGFKTENNSLRIGQFYEK